MKRYQEFARDMLNNYMEEAMPVILEDVHIVND